MNAKFGIILFKHELQCKKSFTSGNRDKGPEFWLALIKFLHILLGCMAILALSNSNMNYSV